MFEDQQIIEQRNFQRRQKFTNIETGIYSGGELLEFEETYLFQQKVGIILPVTFTDMDPEVAKRKYPSEERPQVIKTNRDGSINFTFNLLKQQVEENHLEDIIQDFCKVLKRLYPTNICLNMEQGQGIEVPSAWMEFTSLAINETLYNMLIICPIGEELLMIYFNCPYDERTDWLISLGQIRENVKDYSRGDRDESS